MTIQELRDRKLIVLECISGSRSYGLQLPGSDMDLKGVFVLPEDEYFGMNNIDQVSSEKNDETFYELKRFFELLLRNNPNIIELLGVPEECILYRHPMMELLEPRIFLSRLCRQTFANYAISQIKKSKGLNKKINRAMEKERKNILDFCYVTEGNRSIAFKEWLLKKGLQQAQCGLAAIHHMKDLYALYIDQSYDLSYDGIISSESSNEVNLSAIPKGELSVGYLYFNKDAWSVYCKEYKSYWDWVSNRNELRYQGTLKHGKSYDAKNMMHVFRLLHMAQDIAEGKGVITKRPDRDYLLSIRSGQFEYEQLLRMAEEKMQKIEMLFEHSSLPQVPDSDAVNDLLVRMRKMFYAKRIA